MQVHGRYEEFSGRRYFVPGPLADLPEITLPGELAELYGEAMRSLGRVDGLARSRRNLTDTRALVKAYVMKEALLSSEIEGTVSTLTAVMEAAREPRSGVPKPEDRDTQDVLNYFEASELALKMLRQDGLPLVERVIKAAHAVLLDTEAGQSKRPGEYRNLPVAVGKHYPPSATYVPHLMKDLEAFLNGNVYPPLMKAGIAHVQFETIHPFFDGNGRIGRLLVVLGLVHDGLLQEPLIYPSYYFKRFRSEYYARLDGVRLKGDWAGWLRFYLRAIDETARDTEARLERLSKLMESYRERLRALSVKNGERLLSVLLDSPVLAIGPLAEALGVSYPTASAIVRKLEGAGLLKLRSTQRRNKSYRLEEYMTILEDETLF